MMPRAPEAPKGLSLAGWCFLGTAGSGDGGWQPLWLHGARRALAGASHADRLLSFERSTCSAEGRAVGTSPGAPSPPHLAVPRPEPGELTPTVANHHGRRWPAPRPAQGIRPGCVARRPCPASASPGRTTAPACSLLAAAAVDARHLSPPPPTPPAGMQAALWRHQADFKVEGGASQRWVTAQVMRADRWRWGRRGGTCLQGGRQPGRPSSSAPSLLHTRLLLGHSGSVLAAQSPAAGQGLGSWEPPGLVPIRPPRPKKRRSRPHRLRREGAAGERGRGERGQGGEGAGGTVPRLPASSQRDSHLTSGSRNTAQWSPLRASALAGSGWGLRLGAQGGGLRVGLGAPLHGRDQAPCGPRWRAGWAPRKSHAWATRPLVRLCALAAGTRVALRCARQQEFNADRGVIVFLLLIPSPVNYIATAGAFRCHSPVSAAAWGARITSAHCWCPGALIWARAVRGLEGAVPGPPPSVQRVLRGRPGAARPARSPCPLHPCLPQALPWGLPGWDPWAQLRHQPGNAPHGARAGPARRAGPGKGVCVSNGHASQS